MLCPRCKVKMRVSPTVHHKRRKWICPRCGRAKMESKAARGSVERKGRRESGRAD